ncbi:MAG: TRAP transporter substrate-binding protein [Neomegalonema sp.]|nr:TRAP transporter substrate-binding protein [Neomegalonema sp.]
MSYRLLVAALLAAPLAYAAPAAAKTVLRMSSWLPPGHPVVTQALKPWAEEVEKVTQGRVTVQILPKPAGPPPAHYDLAATGKADITYGVHGYTPGRFKLTQIAELPFLNRDAASMSVAYWRLHRTVLASKNEHAEVKLLSVFVHGPGLLWTVNRPASPLTGLIGARIRVAGAVSQKMISALGMASVQAPAPQTRKLLTEDRADGLAFPAEAIVAFKVDDLVKHGLRVEGGLYCISFFFAMNSERFGSLSKQDQRAIEAISGEALARAAGRAFDAADAASLAAIKGKITIQKVDPLELTLIKAAAQPIYDAVRTDFDAAKLDFDAALAALKKEAAAEYDSAH